MAETLSIRYSDIINPLIEYIKTSCANIEKSYTPTGVFKNATELLKLDLNDKYDSANKFNYYRNDNLKVGVNGISYSNTSDITYYEDHSYIYKKKLYSLNVVIYSEGLNDKYTNNISTTTVLDNLKVFLKGQGIDIESIKYLTVKNIINLIMYISRFIGGRIVQFFSPILKDSTVANSIKMVTLYLTNSITYPPTSTVVIDSITRINNTNINNILNSLIMVIKSSFKSKIIPVYTLINLDELTVSV